MISKHLVDNFFLTTTTTTTVKCFHLFLSNMNNSIIKHLVVHSLMLSIAI